MNSLYCETFVKRKNTGTVYLAKAGVVFAALLLVALAVLFGGSGMIGYIFMMLAALSVVGVFYVMKMFNVDYEYIFCDGQIDFDVISGGERRKTKLRVDFDNLDVMAPISSHELDSLSNRQVKVFDFTSREPDAKRYVLFARDSKNQQQVKVIFEPDEKMVSYSKQKAPRKVFTD